MRRLLTVGGHGRCLPISQDKYLQKVHLQKHGIPLPDFVDVPNLDAAFEAGRRCVSAVLHVRGACPRLTCEGS